VGETTWPCPVCGQAQKEAHDNGQAPTRSLCAACEEKHQEKKRKADK